MAPKGRMFNPINLCSNDIEIENSLKMKKKTRFKVIHQKFIPFYTIILQTKSIHVKNNMFTSTALENERIS